MEYYFLDTNFFIQCKDIKEIRWADIIQENEFTLMISHAVIMEIDKLKYGPDNKRSRRAKKVNKLLGELILNERIIYNVNGVKVNVCIAPELSQNFSEESVNNDTKIIKDALYFKSSNGENGVYMLTYDNIAILSSRKHGPPHVKIPEEWLLPPGKSVEQKEIDNLKKQLASLIALGPDVKVSFLNDKSEPQDVMRVFICEYDAISDDKMEGILRSFKKMCPLTIDFSEEKDGRLSTLGSTVLGSRYIPPSQSEIDKYQNEDYPKYFSSLRKFFKKMPSYREDISRHLALKIFIKNTGGAPAENVIVSVSANNGILLCRKKEMLKEKMPIPPVVPKGKIVNSLFVDPLAELHRASYLNDPVKLVNFNYPAPRERHEFYWDTGKKEGYRPSMRANCEEFRHKIDDKVLSFMVYVPKDYIHDRGILHCTVSSKNAPMIVEKKIIVHVVRERGDMNELIKQYVRIL